MSWKAFELCLAGEGHHQHPSGRAVMSTEFQEADRTTGSGRRVEARREQIPESHS